MLATGNANAIIAGGVELLSDVPIRYNRKARKAMLGMNKANDFLSKLKIGGEIVKNLLSPELPAVAEFSTGETMGHSGDRLAAAFNVSRRFCKIENPNSLNKKYFQRTKRVCYSLAHSCLRSRQKRKLHRFRTGVLRRKEAKNYQGRQRNPCLHKWLSTLKPHGTVTAANASYSTDGASAALIMTEEYALANGFKYIGETSCM